jgi:chromosome segregation ATPase
VKDATVASNDLSSLSYQQLLQLCQCQAVQITTLRACVQQQADSRDAATTTNSSCCSSKAEAASQSAIIVQLQAVCATKDATTASQAAAVNSLTKQIAALQRQLSSALFDAGKWEAAYTALRKQAESKYAALAQESEAVIDQWAAHEQKLKQQAAKAAQKYAALRTHCTELTAQRSSLQEQLSCHEEVLTRSEQLLEDYNLLCERLHSRDATISRRDATIRRQHVKLQQLQQLARGRCDAVVANAYLRLYSHSHRIGSVPSRDPCKSRLSGCPQPEATG